MVKTRCLNLDSWFRPIPYPEITFQNFSFPSGLERHIKIGNKNVDYIKDGCEKVIITCRLKTSDDIFDLLLATDALRRMEIKIIDIVIPFLPYARQDRVAEEGEPLSIKVFTDIINSQNYNKVYVFDAHSEVSVALINNCTNIPNTEYVEKAVHLIFGLGAFSTKDAIRNKLMLASPDAGAGKKSDKLMQLGIFKGLVKCDKKRDTATGKLSGFEVHTDDLQLSDCLIVDDLCDGGGTFIGLAQELQKKNCGKLYLFVTHGIFSKGFEELNKYFSGIYCTNSFSTVDKLPNKPKQINLYL